MPVIHRENLVPYSAPQMYRLVNEIEDYPKFVPWCVSSRVLSRTEDEIHACLSFERGGLQKAFTTCNRLQPEKMIEIRLVNGPFHHLEGFWRFEAIDDEASTVLFDLEYEFSNKLFSFAFEKVFHAIASSLVDAFSKRAREVYSES